MTVHVCICIFISCLHVRVHVAKHNSGEDKFKTMQAVVFIIHVAAHLPQGARYVAGLDLCTVLISKIHCALQCCNLC